MLRGQVAAILIIIGVGYIFIDSLYAIYRNIPLYSAISILGLVTILLNRSNAHIAATIVLCSGVNFLIYLSASSEPNVSGVYIFFIPAAILGMTLVKYENWYLGVGLVLLSGALFLLSYLSEFSFLPKVVESDQIDETYFIINVIVALAISVLLVYFLINLNYTTEKALRQQERVLTETAEALKRSRERFELAVQGSEAGIYEWNLVDGSSYMSTRWKKMLGYSPEELNELDIPGYLNLIHPEDRKYVSEEIQKKINDGLPYKKEFRMIKKNGETIWIYDSGVSKRGEDSKPVIIVGSFVDITERKLVEESLKIKNQLLEQTNAELDRFVYSVSHDLRAPLSSLMGLVTLAEKTNDPEEVTSLLSMMRNRIDAQEKFIRDIIDYSRNARLHKESELINLNDLMREVMDNLQYAEEVSSVKIKTDIPENYILQTDKVRLKIVLNNLVSNALKYHDRHKDERFVLIQVRSESGHCEIHVEDNGMGIKEDHHEKIFDMFYRASENSKGSGLGLYIAREAVKKLGGQITVESELGKGTRFRIILPKQPVEAI